MSPSPAPAVAIVTPNAFAVLIAAMAGAAAGFHGVAFIILLFVMGMDLLTGTHRAHTNPDERFEPEVAWAGLKSKGRRILLVLLAFTADAMLILLARQTGKGEEIAAHCAIAGAAIVAQYVTEGYSVVDNIRRTERGGVGLISKILVAAFDRLRDQDNAAYRDQYGEDVPNRRRTDRQPEVVAAEVAPAVAPIVTTPKETENG